jgi:truncated hemoglobin YjbI
MNDMNERTFVPTDGVAESEVVRDEVENCPAVEAAQPVVVDEVAADVPVEVNGDGAAEESQDWHSEAGRKGAHRVHQLIEKGRLYEQEHGLKSGRQRLRQLIELGKLYEEEHGARPGSEKKRGQRLSRREREELLATFVECLTRIVKPAYRAELVRLLEKLPDLSRNEAA